MRHLVSSLFFVFIIHFPNSAFAKIDDSADIFFPESLKFLQYSQTEFSVFWWNFVIIDPLDKKPNFLTARKICQELRSEIGKEIKQIYCEDDLSPFVPLLKEWAQDVVWRKTSPSVQEMKLVFESNISELSFLSSVNPELFQLKRLDPLDEWQVYLEKNQVAAATGFKRENGFLLDPKSNLLVIPVQFSQKPQMKNILKTKEILNQHTNTVLVGAHSSAYINEKKVHEDMQIVSLVGSLVLIAFIAFLVLKGRLAALLLFPPVALALGLSALLVDLIYGSIHGLTLAFGSGIVGLAVDYGLHGAFNAGSKQTWKSNLIGFLTTLTGLVVMIMSGIPLLRQMMVFATFGLFFGFVFFYFLCRYWPRYFTMESVQIPLIKIPKGHYFVILLIFLGLMSLFATNLSFDLRKINFQSAKDKERTEWFFTRGGPEEESFLLVRPLTMITSKIAEEAQWAKDKGIQYAGLGSFLPEKRDKSSWLKLCQNLKPGLNQSESKVFAPFLENICASPGGDESELFFSQRKYVSHLVSPQGFVSILTSRSCEQAQLIREKFPQAKSLTESIKGFSDSLENDLRWMIPVVFLLSTLILFLYYNSITCVLTAYIPFFTGLGLFFLVNLLKGGELDLISVLGLIMVFGFSLDYGVFATDIYKFPQPGEDESHVYSALGLAAISNIIGFFPMVFAQHPVLHQLGMALFFGTIGTYFGTIWGIEKLFHWRKLV